MSADAKDEHCAGCGIAGADDVKLKRCACKLVKYCGVKCQKEHRPKHKKECKKRAAELRDELLFKQPECNHYGDCQICCLPLPLDPQKISFMPCCSNSICYGCDYANRKREFQGKLQFSCPFCRQPASKSEEEAERILMRRVEANDPDAIGQMGFFRNNAGDHSGAIEYWIRAASLGHVQAHYNLSQMYLSGRVEMDEKKQIYHLEEAAIGGHAKARYNLGCVEEDNGRLDRAIKHWIIAAKLGHNDALKTLKIAYREGLVSKKDFAAALRGHQAAVDATKSPQREKGEAAIQRSQAGRSFREFGSPTFV